MKKPSKSKLATSPKIPRLDAGRLRGEATQLPPSDSQPLPQRKQLGGNTL